MSIVLIGTCHIDPRGESRLLRALEVERPDIVTLELSSEQLDRLKSAVDSIKPKFLGTARKLGLSDSAVAYGLAEIDSNSNPYELRASRDYASRNSIPIHFINGTNTSFMQDISRRFGINYNAVTKEQLEYSCNAENVSKIVDNVYFQIQRCYDGSAPADEVQELVNCMRDNGIIGGIDINEALEIRRICSANPGKRVVHVGGAGHNLSDRKGETLYERIRDLCPMRRTLAQYENLEASK